MITSIHVPCILAQVVSSPTWSQIFLLGFVEEILPFFICSGLLFLVCYVFLRGTILHRKIQSAFPVSADVRREFFLSLSSTVVFAATAILDYELYRFGWTQFYFNINTYGWLYLFASIFFLVLMQDAWFYWAHRLLHWKPLFKRVHSIHHSFHNPTPWASFAFHPVEALINAIFFPLAIILIPVHPLAAAVWLFYMFFITAYEHSGFEFLPEGSTRHWFWRCAITSTHHNQHHSEIRDNYGLYFTFWDRFMGTTHRNYDKKFDEIARKSIKSRSKEFARTAGKSGRLKSKGIQGANFLSPWIGTLLSSLLIVVCFEPFGWWWCGWIVLAPAWIILRGSPEVRLSPLRYGNVIGLFFVVGCFWWTGAVTLVGLFIMALVLSVYPGLWFLFVARLLRLPENGGVLSLPGLVTRACLAAVFWVALEWLRSWFMGGFNWNELGVSQVPSLHLRQLAAVGGVPLLSGTLVLTAVLIGEAGYTFLQRQWRAAGISFLGATLVIAASWSYGAWRLSSFEDQLPRASISYAAIQPNIAELPYGKASPAEITRLEVDAMNIQQDLSARAAAAQPDLIIWPEAITSQPLTSDSLVGQVINHLREIYHGEILLGAEDYQAGKLYNTACLLGSDGSWQSYHKVYLVWLGEYFPGTEVFPSLRRWWGRGFPVTAGTVPGHLLLQREGLSLAPLICFEDTQPQVARNAAAEGPDFFVTLVNAGWFTGILADWCLKQHLANATLRCVEHDRPMIRCADTGITCEIDVRGSAFLAPAEKPGVLYRRLALYPWNPTIYDKWGDWFGLLCRLMTLLVCISFIARVISRFHGLSRKL